MTSASSEHQPKATFKRDHLRAIEKKMQARWEAEKIFETDAPSPTSEEASQEKFMATFPYPYMNGRLHLGHSFSLSKAEFAAAFERMQGKRVLFPFGFHCTGMPIKVGADKLKSEIEAFGNPPRFPTETDDLADGKVDAKHSKVAAKTGGVKYQWQIMEAMGIPPNEIATFADPSHWISYFPPATEADLRSLGLHVDWRRSFVTTDANPFYDSFIRWQFNKLRKQDKIRFGKRYTVFSPKDAQPCMDHDRQSGEGVEPKEYTLIKMQIVGIPETGPLAILKGKKVSLVAATLRPETMYGQTNCWIGLDIQYGAYLSGDNGDAEVFICTERCAKNLAYQGYSPAEGKIKVLTTFKGTDLIGLTVKAPMSIYEHVHVLPMMGVSKDKGSGIVTGVPSNSPDDWATLRDLIEKEPLRRKLNVQDAHVIPFVPIPILKTEAYGDVSAKTVCDILGIKSQNDHIQLAKAKDMCYKEDFYTGVMLVGEYKGMSVSEAKPLIRAKLIEQNDALIYYEPENLVMSRSGEECVVALVDQWFIAYGEPAWRAETEKCLAKMDTYSPEVRHMFEATLAWMNQWACSRSFGLGSRLPWDPSYLIESLSDSTVYMAYYTVAHILHGGSLDGSAKPHSIAPEDMTDEVWEFVLSDGKLPKSNIPTSLLEKMRQEFRYFYPLDLRVSGKDLVPNHLTFFLYNHVALFPESHWPKSVRANGHLLLNSSKMSKSTGNFMTLSEAVEEFSADGCRVALADAGDGMEDANFLKDTANIAILRLYTQLEFFTDVLAKIDQHRSGKADMFADRVFESEINQAIQRTEAAYRSTHYRDALKFGFFELQNARDHYQDVTVIHGKIGMHAGLLKRFIEVQALLLAPIAPHFSEYVWTELLGNQKSIMHARWPQIGIVDETILSASSYVQGVMRSLRALHQAETEPKKGKPALLATKEKLNAVEVYVAESYPQWQESAIQILHSHFNEISKTFAADDVIVEALKPLTADRPNKKLIPFVMDLKKRILADGIAALNRKLPFDEQNTIKDNMDWISRSLDLVRIDVCPVDPTDIFDKGMVEKEHEKKNKKIEASIPGVPTAHFYHAPAN